MKIAGVGERSLFEASIEEDRRAGKVPVSYHVRSPGEDATWDAPWIWPAPRGPRLPPREEALLISPLLKIGDVGVR